MLQAAAARSARRRPSRRRTARAAPPSDARLALAPKLVQRRGWQQTSAPRLTTKALTSSLPARQIGRALARRGRASSRRLQRKRRSSSRAGRTPSPSRRRRRAPRASAGRESEATSHGSITRSTRLRLPVSASSAARRASSRPISALRSGTRASEVVVKRGALGGCGHLETSFAREGKFGRARRRRRWRVAIRSSSSGALISTPACISPPPSSTRRRASWRADAIGTSTGALSEHSRASGVPGRLAMKSAGQPASSSSLKRHRRRVLVDVLLDRLTAQPELRRAARARRARPPSRGPRRRCGTWRASPR